MKNVIIYLLILCMLAGIGYSYIKYNEFKSDLASYDAKIDSTLVTKKKFKNLYENSSREIENIKSRNKKLKEFLNKRNKKINLQTKVIGNLADSIKNIKTVSDTIYTDSSYTSIMTFSKQFGAFYISGWFENEEPFRLTIDSLSAQINLEINYSRNKNNKWDTYVDVLTENVMIDGIKTKTNLEEDSFYDKLEINAGIMGMSKYLFLYGEVRYTNLGISIGYGTGGPLLGVSWKLK